MSLVQASPKPVRLTLSRYGLWFIFAALVIVASLLSDRFLTGGNLLNIARQTSVNALLAFDIDDIYASCRQLQEGGVAINRPPRDGRMAFVRTPDRISIELLQKGGAKAPAEPWASMPNTGEW